VNADGELSVDEFTLEDIKLEQMRASGALHDLHLELRQTEARCAGGTLRARLRAAFLPRPSYDVTAELERVDLRQVPTPGTLTERFTGLASGIVHLTTQGVGRDELLQHLIGKGDLKLRDVEFRGWDVNASMAEGHHTKVRHAGLRGGHFLGARSWHHFSWVAPGWLLGNDLAQGHHEFCGGL